MILNISFMYKHHRPFLILLIWLSFCGSQDLSVPTGDTGLILKIENLSGTPKYTFCLNTEDDDPGKYQIYLHSIAEIRPENDGSYSDIQIVPVSGIHWEYTDFIETSDEITFDIIGELEQEEETTEVTTSTEIPDGTTISTSQTTSTSASTTSILTTETTTESTKTTTSSTTQYNNDDDDDGSENDDDDVNENDDDDETDDRRRQPCKHSRRNLIKKANNFNKRIVTNNENNFFKKLKFTHHMYKGKNVESLVKINVLVEGIEWKEEDSVLSIDFTFKDLSESYIEPQKNSDDEIILGDAYFSTETVGEDSRENFIDIETTLSPQDRIKLICDHFENNLNYESTFGIDSNKNIEDKYAQLTVVIVMGSILGAIALISISIFWIKKYKQVSFA